MVKLLEPIFRTLYKLKPPWREPCFYTFLTIFPCPAWVLLNFVSPRSLSTIGTTHQFENVRRQRLFQNSRRESALMPISNQPLNLPLTFLPPRALFDEVFRENFNIRRPRRRSGSWLNQKKNATADRDEDEI